MGLQGGLHEESYERIDKPNHTALSSCLRTRCLSDLLPAAPERRYCPEDRNESAGCFPIACTCTVLLGRPASPARACPPDGLVPDPQTPRRPTIAATNSLRQINPQPRTATAQRSTSRPADPRRLTNGATTTTSRRWVQGMVFSAIPETRGFVRWPSPAAQGLWRNTFAASLLHPLRRLFPAPGTHRFGSTARCKI